MQTFVFCRIFGGKIPLLPRGITNYHSFLSRQNILLFHTAARFNDGCLMTRISLRKWKDPRLSSARRKARWSVEKSVSHSVWQVGTRWNGVLLFAVPPDERPRAQDSKRLEKNAGRFVDGTSSHLADVTPETPGINIFTLPAASRTFLRDLPSIIIVWGRDTWERLKGKASFLSDLFSLNPCQNWRLKRDHGRNPRTGILKLRLSGIN